ncbi:winged helix-turn-helix transcriptional regulator [Neptuniibacter sp. QD29_5]|uniref:winged helix-turn-helix transcriptional regulator n=1 Tax=Neptuniibacter sp. QD29_5 TaxID=3398207 RepID=UPI0039F49334
MKKTLRSSCPINFGLEIFGDQWSLMIIRDIVFNQKSTYGDFLNSAEGISTNILAKRLTHLLESGLLTKHKCPDNGRIIRYGLTDKGKSLIPVLLEMIIWGADNGEHNPSLSAWANAIRTDKEQALKDALARLEQ